MLLVQCFLLDYYWQIRMEERSGIVPARMRGIRAANAPVVVILDSHIEVNDGWLEPQLSRIQESPKSFVFPQTLSILATNFMHSKDAGIGCDWCHCYNADTKINPGRTKR